jgi:fructose-bisphosphate aldolase class II
VSLCNLNEILPEAVAKGYGVLATVLFNFDFADAVVRAAEEKKSPVILMFSEPLLEKYGYKEFDKLINPVRILVQEARVPVVLHLDHGKNLKNIIHFMKSGLTSVMISQTFRSFEEDIKVAREVTEIAHSMNITVEGEVGKMPGEGGLESSMKNKSSIEQIREGFTKVEEAVRFVEETNVDVLSISVGTAHGFFDKKPELDFDLIRKIKDAVKIPLVIHGASGLENEQYKGAIRNGVVKFNYLTGLIEEAKDKVRKIVENSDDFSYIDLHFEVSRAFIEKVKSLIDTLRDV